MPATPFRTTVFTLLAAAFSLASAIVLGDAPLTETGDGKAGPALTADTLAAWTLQANPGLAAALASAESAAFRIDPAGSLDDPVLSYSAAPNTADSPRGLQQKLDFSQKIPWPGTLATRQEAARHEAAASDLELDALRLEVIAKAKSAYAEWRYIGQAFEIHHTAASLLDELISVTQTRYAAGRALKQDVLHAQIERTELHKHLLKLRGLRSAVRARINALLNRPPESPLPPAAPIPEPSSPPALASLLEQALARHPELARLDARVAAGESRVVLAEKAFYPDLKLGVSYNEVWDAADKRAMVGVSINLPLDRGKRKAELGSARARVRSAEWALADRRAALLSDLARAHAEVTESRDSVELYRSELLPLADDYLKAALADYRSGSGAFLNVITAEQRLIDTQLAEARARADYARRRAELDLWSAAPTALAEGRAK